MGMLGKLAFWKKEEDDGINNDPIHFDAEREGINPEDRLDNPFLDRGMSEEREDLASNFDSKKPFQVHGIQNNSIPNQVNSFDMNLTNKNIEIISVKLDALKSELESMSQRLKNIEEIAKRENSSHTMTNMPNYKRYPQW